MNKQDAEKIITEYVKPIFGFALKRAKTEQDAEDLSQEIVLRAFRALLAKDDIADTNKFIWAVAHNTLANYYRDAGKHAFNVSIDEISETLAGEEPEFFGGDEKETLARLQKEIAYLSRTQRRVIIAYYFENRKQTEIAAELGIPLGTVKWHLFEAKKDLKRGMDTMRKASELKFNPIKFENYGLCGSVGEENLDNFLRSSLAQNILYSVKNTPKTINEIADDLGVSPVYVESEAKHLEKYVLLTLEKEKYLSNIVIEEPTSELLTIRDAMYKKAANLFASELYEKLTKSGILDDESIICAQKDKNFLLWSLIPLISSLSGEHIMEEKIKFSEAATLRPDGGHNICVATVINRDIVLPEDYIYMKNWFGPCWSDNTDTVLWRVDSEWSESRVIRDRRGFDETERVIMLYKREKENGALNRDDAAWLAERGYVKTDENGKVLWQIVILANKEIQQKLIAIGDEIKENLNSEFTKIKKAYIDAELASVQTHMRKAKEYTLQYLFSSDGWFLLHCLKALVASGKLQAPKEEQRKAITTVIMPKI
ncbi:MAG: sigma-70 family RNA polymerase sigma factor [Clostridia bacterium]|nr:sigma-70 family RNA polymerase sigma factor [Clostridia bacterium]